MPTAHLQVEIRTPDPGGPLTDPTTLADLAALADQPAATVTVRAVHVTERCICIDWPAAADRTLWVELRPLLAAWMGLPAAWTNDPEYPDFAGLGVYTSTDPDADPAAVLAVLDCAGLRWHLEVTGTGLPARPDAPARPGA
jgi:hypothetical protein